MHHEFIPSLGTYHIALKFEESANFWRSAKAGLHNLKRSLEHQETGQKAWWHDLHHEKVVKEGGRQIVAQLRRPEQPPNSASTYSIETKVESSRCDNNSLSKRLTSKCWWVYLKRMCSLVLVLYAVVQETASNCHCDYCLQDKFAVTSSGGSGCCHTTVL